MVNFDLEKKSSINNIIMIGVDEAGRGSWAGPLVATASWLNFKDYKSLHKEINDSKKLKSNKRKEIILSLNNSVKYCSSISSEREIDFYGLTYANTMAMKRSIFSLLEILNYYIIYKNCEFKIFIDGKYKPNLVWQMLVFPYNEHQVEEAERLSKEIGFDEFHYSKSLRSYKSITFKNEDDRRHIDYTYA